MSYQQIFRPVRLPLWVDVPVYCPPLCRLSLRLPVAFTRVILLMHVLSLSGRRPRR